MLNDVQPDQRIGRELSLGEVISKTFEVYQRDFTKYFVLFAIVEVITGIIDAAARQYFVLPTLPPNPTPDQAFTWFPGFLGALVSMLAVDLLVVVLFFPVAQGTAIRLASERIEGRQTDLGTSVRFAVSRLVWIWALAILVGIIVALGFVALVVPGVILAIMFCLAFPVLLIENRGVLESMGRSRELVGHRWGKTFVTFLVFGIIVLVGATIVSAISAPFGAAGPVVNGILSASYQPILPIALVTYYYSNLARLSPAGAGQTPMAPTMAQAGTKFCPSCGARLASSSTFCPNCGAKQPV